VSSTITGEIYRRGGNTTAVTGWPIGSSTPYASAGVWYVDVHLLTADGTVVDGVKVRAEKLDGVRVRPMPRYSDDDAFLWRVAERNLLGQGERAFAELAWRERERQAEMRRVLARSRQSRIRAFRSREVTR
jgi:hypothetical protein